MVVAHCLVSIYLVIFGQISVSLIPALALPPADSPPAPATDGAALPASGGPRAPPVPPARGRAALAAGAARTGARARAALRARAGPVPGAVRARQGGRAARPLQGLRRERAPVLQVGGGGGVGGGAARG